MPIADRVASAWRALGVGRWFLLFAVTLAVAAVLLIRYELEPVPTSFRASVAARKITFTLADDPDRHNAGIFNSTRVHLVLLDPTLLQPDQGAAFRCVSNAAFQDVELLRMAIPENTRVSLEADDDGILHYSLLLPKDAAGPFLTLGGGKIAPRDLPCTPAQSSGTAARLVPGNWRIQPDDPASPFRFSVEFLHGRSGSAPLRETMLPIEPASDLLIQSPSDPGEASQSSQSGATTGSGNSSHSKDKNELHYTLSGRNLPIVDDLVLKSLTRSQIQALSFQPGSGALKIIVTGTAVQITSNVGAQETDRTESRYAPLRPFLFNHAIGSIGGLLSGIAALLSAYFTLHTILDAKRKSLEDPTVPPKKVG